MTKRKAAFCALDASVIEPVAAAHDMFFNTLFENCGMKCPLLPGWVTTQKRIAPAWARAQPTFWRETGKASPYSLSRHLTR